MLNPKNNIVKVNAKETEHPNTFGKQSIVKQLVEANSRCLTKKQRLINHKSLLSRKELTRSFPGEIFEFLLKVVFLRKAIDDK